MGSKERPQKIRCPLGRAFNTVESQRLCRGRDKGSKLLCLPLKLPSPKSPKSPNPAGQAAYLSGKEAFGSVFAQGSQATRPRTLACTDGLLSCRQDFIQFVWGEAEEGQRDSEMKLAWAWRAQRRSFWAPHSVACMNQGRASLSPSRRASLETQGPAGQGRWDAAMERAEGREEDSHPSREGGCSGGRRGCKEAHDRGGCLNLSAGAQSGCVDDQRASG